MLITSLSSLLGLHLITTAKKRVIVVNYIFISHDNNSAITEVLIWTLKIVNFFQKTSLLLWVVHYG